MIRLLACGEFTQLSSGYAVYMRELLTELNKYPDIEIAELACFCHPQDERIELCPWKVYPIAPNKSDRAAVDRYNSNPLLAFGAELFEEVLLDFKPTHVIDIRDNWHIEHESRSPLRKFFAHVIMPAIDAYPQHRSWIDMYSEADKLLSYTDWGIDVLKKYGLKNVHKSAAPCPSKEYKPIPEETKSQLKSSLNLGNPIIIGTVMRNQPRKLFPDLFRDFKRLLVEKKRDNVYLLCHTSMPDTWELDELLLEYGVQDRVLFSYVCKSCEKVEISFYKGTRCHCNNCKNYTLMFSGTQLGISNDALNQIYNLMDVYVQYHTNEGYGIPLVEAIACGVPIFAIDYSAPTEIISKSNGVALEPIGYVKEPGSGRLFAIPNGDEFVKKMDEFLSLSIEERKQAGNMSRLLYGIRPWSDVARAWYMAIKSCKPERDWLDKNRYYNPPPSRLPQGMNNSHFARFLITNVLQEPDKIGSYMEARLIRDLNNGYAYRGFSGKYYHENYDRSNNITEFNRDLALTHFLSLLEEKVNWENRRLSI